jgi:hypothetical protein
MDSKFTEEDEGKRVVGPDGEEIGIVTGVDGDRADVEADPSAVETVKSKLGWEDSGDDTYEISTSAVETVTDDEVRLQRNL